MSLISNRLSTASIKYLNWPSHAFGLFQNECNEVVIEPRVVQFWSEIILVFSNWTRAARSIDFEITCMITAQIALHSVQLPLFIALKRGAGAGAGAGTGAGGLWGEHKGNREICSQWRTPVIIYRLGRGGGGRGGVGELWGELRGNREVYSKWGAPVIIHRQGGGLRSRKTMRRTQGEQRSQKQIRGKGHYLSPGRGWGGVGGLRGGALEYYRDSWKGSGKYEKLWCSDPRPAINNDRSFVSRKGPSSDTCVACVQN